MSHDTDKLIRQLSLVAFLMAERRPLTARDVKGNVEGYSEMSDEAFARRFYSDRAELTGLGVPLHSQRDEFTGEELYTLRSENYFLDRLDLEGRRARRAADGALLPRRQVRVRRAAAARAPEPRARASRLPGRAARRLPSASASAHPTTRPSSRDGCRSSRRRSPSSARSSSRYWSPLRDKVSERTLNPYALRLDEGIWYVVGLDLDRDAVRTFRVSRIRSDIRFATRRERDFRLPTEFDVEAHRVPRPWQIGDTVGIARIAVQDDTAWWVDRTLSDAGTLEDGVFETSFARIEPLAGWVLRQNGRAVPLEPKVLLDAVADGLAPPSRGARGGRRRPGARAARRSTRRPRRAAGRSDRAGALRRPPGAPRPPALRVRREPRGAPRSRRPCVALLDPARGAAGHALAPQPRQLRGRLLHGLRGGRRGRRATCASTRSCTATSSAGRPS